MPRALTIRSRRAQLEALGNHIFDVLVLGGGISGVTAAHEFTRRGYRTALIDSHDFGSGTSQESSQLIWGGIKYLEKGHVGLVQSLCAARNQWVEQYPNRVERQRFLYPRYSHDAHALPTILAGAWAYWVIGGAFGFPPLYRSSLAIEDSAPRLRMEGVRGGLEYTDARMVDSDARLVLDTLFDAVDAGLTAVNYAEFRDIRRLRRHAEFEADVRDSVTGRNLVVRSQWIVNTTGVWVDEVNARLGVEPPHRICFSKGAHLIVPRIETGEKALTCVAKDGRIFFVVPWGEGTLVGTTDTPHEAPPARVRADAADIEYLRSECEAKFNLRIGDADILNTKAGLRPLVRPQNMDKTDFLDLSRSHKVWGDDSSRISALWGGKYTDAFVMARELADTVTIAPSDDAGLIPLRPAQTYPPSESYLDGGGEASVLADACGRELVVRLEDLMRRRTNLGLKIARSGWGHDGEHERALARFAAAVGEATGSPPDRILAEYREATLESAPSGTV
jgi:glycerol-3-phosphate dehydrogenase